MSSIRLFMTCLIYLLALMLAGRSGNAVADRSDQLVEGSLVWENRGQPEPVGAGLSLAASEGVVVAVGNVCEAPGSVTSCNWFVRAHDARTGRTLWEDRLNAGAFDRSQSVVIEAGRVFASGWFQVPLAPPRGLFDFVVRSYDLRSGKVLWTQQIDRGTQDFAEQIAVKDGRVFAVGRVRGAVSGSDFALFAFDAATGAKLWESVVNLFQVDVAFAVAASRDAVYSAGPTRNLTALLVRAHDARTGRLLWQDEVKNGRMFSTGEGRLIAQGSRLFVAGGVMTASGDQDLFVRAYDARTGSAHWTLQLDAGGNDEVGSLSLDGYRMYAGGFEGCDANFVACSFAVRALDPSSGGIFWTNRFQHVRGGDSNVNAIVARGNRVFAAGNAQDAAGRYQWALRIHDGFTGALLKMDLVAPGNINAVVPTEDLVYATGDIAGAFTVRAYRAKGLDGP